MGDLFSFNSRFLARLAVLVVLALLTATSLSQTETTTLDVINVGEEKMEDPYIEGFKSYAKELAGDKGVMQDSVQSYTVDLIKNKSFKPSTDPSVKFDPSPEVLPNR